MGSATRAITDQVTKQIVTIFSKTCNNNISFHSYLSGKDKGGGGQGVFEDNSPYVVGTH